MNIRKLLSTFFYTGFLPYAPGTYASVLAASIYVIYRILFPSVYFVTIILAAVLTGLCLWLGKWAQGYFKDKDPRQFVLDEAAGMFLALSFFDIPIGTIAPFPPVIVALVCLVLFRIFDIWKPFPIRKVEKMGGAKGIVFDDLVAGAYANLCAKVILFIVILVR